MPEIIKFNEINEKKIIKYIKENKIFIYPTDTIYGLGCNALSQETINKIRAIKDRYDKPFSIIAPSKQWIYSNFKYKKAYVQTLPGPFTFILEAKKKNINIKHLGLDNKYGIRIPDQSFTKIIQKSKLPFITTSVNEAGKKPITRIEEIPKRILKGVDVIIDAGILENKPSVILDMTGDIVRIIRL